VCAGERKHRREEEREHGKEKIWERGVEVSKRERVNGRRKKSKRIGAE